MMRKFVSATRPARQSAMIETLETRQLLSASPALLPDAAKVAKVIPLATLKAVSPGKILAGKTGTEVVTIHNTTGVAETVAVIIALAPSLDGVTAAGEYSSPDVSETLTLKKNGAVAVKVPFIPPITLSAGKYHTLVTADVGSSVYTGMAPGTYTLTLPPLPTTTPSLVGDYSGIIEGYASTSSSVGLFGSTTHTTIRILTFNWTTTAQTDDSLTGIFAVGAQQSAGTMTGTELTNGVIDYTFASDLINYTMVGKITEVKGVQTLSGSIQSTLVGNLFSKLNGKFKIALQST